MSSLNVAVVGVGALGRHHARILAGMEGVNLCAVADTNPDQGQAIAEQHGSRWVANYRELFDCVDAVSLAVPTHAHLAIASEFLSRQIPVLVENRLPVTWQKLRNWSALLKLTRPCCRSVM